MEPTHGRQGGGELRAGRIQKGPGSRGCSGGLVAVSSLLERVIRGNNWDHLTLQMLLCTARQEDRSRSTIIH